jgi:glycosyltransferase involved in cell wall biosynthesis
VEHAPEDTAALRASDVKAAGRPPLNGTDERGRRFLRLIREAENVPVPPQSLNPLERRILELERDLTLVSLSRLYRLGKTLRRIVERIRGVRRSPAPPAVPAPEQPTPLDVTGLPSGTGRPVIFFVPWLLHGGGGERVVSDLARGLVADGRSVAVVVTARTPVEMLDATEDMLEVTPHVFDLRAMLDERDRVPFCTQLVARSEAPIAVNVGSEWFYEHLDELKASGELKVVDTLFNHVGHIRNNVANAAAIDTTVAAHRSLARLLVDYYEVPTDVQTVYVGIDPPEPGQSRTEERVPVLGWIGRLSSEKRPAWFVELARRIGDGARFRLAGDGPDAAAIAVAARGVGSLEVLGFVGDNISFIDGCDLVVITSEVEGISIVAMEAISRGVPVLSTDVGGMPDLIRQGVNGELVPADDFEALVQRVGGLVDDPRSLRELRERVRASGLDDQFTGATMLAHFRKILS